MNSHNRTAEELRRREQELLEREHAIRLREMEADLYRHSPKFHQTTRYKEPRSQMQQRLQQVLNVAKFLGIVVAVIVAVKIATWLAGALLVGAIAWIVCKLFFENNAPKR